MNGEFLDLVFNEAGLNGYNGSIEDFKTLISTNDKALKVAFDIAIGKGYKDGPDSFSGLLGLESGRIQDIEETERYSPWQHRNREDFEKIIPDPETKSVEETEKKVDLTEGDIIIDGVNYGSAEKYEKNKSGNWVNTELGTDAVLWRGDDGAWQGIAHAEQLNKTLEELTATRLPQVEAELFGREEQMGIKYLRQKYQGLGYTFEETGWDIFGQDYILATSPPDADGISKTEKFSFDIGVPIFGGSPFGGQEKEADRFNKWIESTVDSSEGVDIDAYSFALNFADSLGIEVKNEDGSIKSISELTAEELDEHSMLAYLKIEESPEFVRAVNDIRTELQPQMDEWNKNTLLPALVAVSS